MVLYYNGLAVGFQPLIGAWEKQILRFLINIHFIEFAERKSMHKLAYLMMEDQSVFFQIKTPSKF